MKYTYRTANYYAISFNLFLTSKRLEHIVFERNLNSQSDPGEQLECKALSCCSCKEKKLPIN